MKIEELWLYPVKSLGGYSVSEMSLAGEGPVGDREFVVVDEAGRFLSQRQLGLMASVRARREGLALILEKGDRRCVVPYRRQGELVPVTVWNDQFQAFRTEPEADHFLSEVLGRPVRLLQYTSQAPRLRVSPQGESFETRMTDSAPLLLTTRASLEDLNSRLKSPIEMRRFRPNIVIDGERPWEEESWTRLQIGEAEFVVHKPCVRCKIITLDPDTGESTGPEPLEVLHSLAKSPQPSFGLLLRKVTTPFASIAISNTVAKKVPGSFSATT